MPSDQQLTPIKPGVCSPGVCMFCGCHYRKPSDVMKHRCAAMQLAEGPVPDEAHPGYVWPTWADALRDAHRGVAAAYDRRTRTFTTAHTAGISFADIGAAVGLSAAGVHKIVGNSARATLDDPAGA